MKRIPIVALAAVGVSVVWFAVAYQRDIAAARRRVSAGSAVVETRCGPIEPPC